MGQKLKYSPVSSKKHSLKTQKSRMLTGVLAFWVIGLGLSSASSRAAEPAQAATSSEGEKVDVDALKQKYWAKGEQSELQIIQNRLYTKSHKVEVGVMGGVLSTDPFLSVKTLGGHLAYHLSEYVSISLLGWKSFVSDSAALTTLHSDGLTTFTNTPKSFLGAEMNLNALYGKLSVFGNSIVYYDILFSAGVGENKTETGSYLTPNVGVGEKIYLSRVVALSVDYRLLYFKENVTDLPIKNRTNFTQIFWLGFDFLIGG